MFSNSRGTRCQALLRTRTGQVSALSVEREHRYWCSPFTVRSGVTAVAPWRSGSSLPTLVISTAEAHRHQRAARQPGLEILGSTQVREDAYQDRALFLTVSDRGRAGGKIGHNTLLEVEREVGVGEQIGIPVAPPGRARQVDLVIHSVEPGLDPTRETTVAPDGGDIDGPVISQSVAHALVHEHDVPLLSVVPLFVRHPAR